MKVFRGCLGPIFCDPFWQGCSVGFVISLYLPKKYDTPSSLEAFLLGLAPEEAPLCIKRQGVSACVLGKKDLTPVV